MLKQHISKPRLLDKSRALWRRECKRDPSLPPLSPVAGKVEVKDAIRVVLPIIGGKAIYTATPVGGWRFEPVSFDFSGVAPTIVSPAAAIIDQAKPDYDALLDLFVGLERRMCAFEAKHLPNNNVVHFSNVAAE